MELTVLYYLIPSLIMFGCGVYGFITRKNLIAILISLELMLNSVDINFVVFNRFLFPGQMEGMFFTLFAIAIAAAETALRGFAQGIGPAAFSSGAAFGRLPPQS